jgi:nitronate monooxygenase
VVIQVTSLDEARQALDAGADVVVTQGGEAGGHGGRRGTLPFVPAVVDLADPVPVLAAGGIADGRGLAALVLGVAGALVGTQFVASVESLASSAVAKALVESHGEETESSREQDIAASVPWPRQYPGRSIRNAFGDRWRGREEGLAASPGALRSYREAVAVGDPEAVPVWAGEDIDLIHDIETAAAIVETLTSGAEHALARAVSGRSSRPPLVSACPGRGMATQARVLYLLRSGTTGRRATAERQATTVSASAVRIESISPGKRVSRSSLRRHM